MKNIHFDKHFYASAQLADYPHMIFDAQGLAFWRLALRARPKGARYLIVSRLLWSAAKQALPEGCFIG